MILGRDSPLELDYISQWAIKVPKNGVIVELGTFMGKSAVCWAMNADPTVTIYCIDSFEEEYKPTSLISSRADPHDPFIPHNGNTYNVYAEFLKNTATYKNIVPIRGTLPNNIHFPKIDIDLLYIDLAHVNPIDWESIMYFLPYMKNESLICGHDYLPIFPDVISNANTLAKMLDAPVDFPVNSSLWSVQLIRKNDKEKK